MLIIIFVLNKKKMDIAKQIIYMNTNKVKQIEKQLQNEIRNAENILKTSYFTFKYFYSWVSILVFAPIVTCSLALNLMDFSCFK